MLLASLTDKLKGLSTNVVSSATSSQDIQHVGEQPAASVFDCSDVQPGGQQLLNGSSAMDKSRSPRTWLSAYLKRITTRTQDTARLDHMVALHQLVLALERPLLTLETGFANGGSAVAILATLSAQTKQAGQQEAVHIAVDPLQGNYNKMGLNGVAHFFSTWPDHQSRVSFLHLNETADAALGSLVRSHQCVDLFFMDGHHLFDDNMLELYYAHRLLQVGGVLAMHDMWMPSVRKAMKFATSNLGFQSPRTGLSKDVGILVKTHVDRRDWQHFQDF